MRPGEHHVIEDKARIERLVPMAHALDVPASIAFYEKLGFTTTKKLDHAGKVFWAWLTCGAGNLMLSQASGKVDAEQQAVLFYLYTKDLEAFRAAVIANGVAAGPITRPFYMPAGECRIHDPDGYVLLVGQTE